METQQAEGAKRVGRVTAAGGITLAASLVTGAGVAHANTFTVSTLDDSGSGSLRAAITAANANPDADTIVFASGLSGTIHLTTSYFASASDLDIHTPVDIQGPGPGQITVTNDLAGYRIAYVHPGPHETATISGLTLTGGNSG